MTAFDTDVLIVDDDTMLREFLTFMLTEEGYRVRCAADGRAALTEIMRAAPKLVVSDILMPNLSGVELATILRETGSSVALILMSAGHPDPKLDGVCFLRKPFDVEHFLDTVAASLAPRQVTDRLMPTPPEVPLSTCPDTCDQAWRRDARGVVKATG